MIETHVENKKVKKIIDGKEQEVDKKWTYFELSGYTFMSFNEYYQMALSLGSGLRKLGMKQDDKLHLFAGTRWALYLQSDLSVARLLILFVAHIGWPWHMVCSLPSNDSRSLTVLGAGSQSMPIVTAYDTLGEEGLRHSLVQTQSKAIFLDPTLIPTLSNCLKDAKTIQTVIYNTDSDVKKEHLEKLKSDFSHLTVVSIDELKKAGEESPVDPVPPNPEDLCCVMYTSGSTGPPKGVLLKHKAVVAASKST